MLEGDEYDPESDPTLAGHSPEFLVLQAAAQAQGEKGLCIVCIRACKTERPPPDCEDFMILDFEKKVAALRQQQKGFHYQPLAA